jgi:hypothetical protein
MQGDNAMTPDATVHRFVAAALAAIEPAPGQAKAC